MQNEMTELMVTHIQNIDTVHLMELVQNVQKVPYECNFPLIVACHKVLILESTFTRR